MRVLLTNDDGIHAEGLWALYHAFQPSHQTVVVAPDRERTAVSHAITIHDPIRASQVMANGGAMGYAVSGTPADCVKLALQELLSDPPDMLVSGINPGANVGENISYSGTVAAAREAALNRIPAIAVSVDSRNPRFLTLSADFIVRLARTVAQRGLPRGTFLNVNIPDCAMADIKGVKFSRQGWDLYSDHFERRTDPRNRVYYWQGMGISSKDSDSKTDGVLLHEGFISITPIKCDMTDYDTMEKIESWTID